MQTRFYLLFIGLLFLSLIQRYKGQNRIQNGCMCPHIGQHVCYSDGRVYMNDCIAECANIFEGEVQREFYCSPKFKRISDCEFICSLFEKPKLENQQNTLETALTEPEETLINTQNNSLVNQTLLSSCDPVCQTHFRYQRQCFSNGRIYADYCRACHENGVDIKFEFDCGYPVDGVACRQECSARVFQCSGCDPNDLLPVCADDGNIYINECFSQCFANRVNYVLTSRWDDVF